MSDNPLRLPLANEATFAHGSHVGDCAGLDAIEQLDQPLAFFVPILSTHKTLRDLGARDLDFELVHQITHGFAACLAVDQSPVVDQPTPMIERILVDRTTSPSPSASDSSNEI